MSFKDIPKNLEITLCESCPARRAEIFVARLRGSSFRGRLISGDEEFNVDNCVFTVGDIVVANVQIANIDGAAAEQDAEVITAGFEVNAEDCKEPDMVLSVGGLQAFCAPINRAVDEFVKINYTVD